jgi:hypothetical protein
MSRYRQTLIEWLSRFDQA